MTTSAPFAAAAASSEEALIERARRRRVGRLRRRFVAATSAGLLAVVAVTLPFVFGAGHVRLLPALLAVTVYAVCCRVEFEVSFGIAQPSQIAFVPLWFVLPPQLLPSVVAGALVAVHVQRLARGQFSIGHTLLASSSAWYAVGPAAVLLAFGEPGGPRWSHWPVYAAAFAAQLAANFLYAIPPARGAGLTLNGLLRMVAPAFAVDAALAPVGLALAFPVAVHPAVLVSVLPVAGLLSVFARERTRRIDNALELSSAYRGTALLLGDVIEADDAYTGSHSRDVVELVLAVSDRLGLDAAARREAEFVALLHDVGKVKMPSEIINKAGPLDGEEWAIMRMHTIEGERMLEQVGGMLGRVGSLVRSCHERWDGGGYPDGLAGDETPLVARIVCCCDAFSAMTTDRPYRSALPRSEALAELRRCRGTHFDPRVVDALLAVA